MKYSEEQLKQMRDFEAVMWLKDLKEGDPITSRHIEAVKRILGDIHAKIGEPKSIATIHFDKVGQPHTLNDDIIDVKRINVQDKPHE